LFLVSRKAFSSVVNVLVREALCKSLANIKESYELGIEIDTESGLGDVFSTMFGIDRSKLPKDAEDAVKQMTDEWNKVVDRYNAVNIKSPIKKIDILSTTPQQFNEIQNVNVKSGIATEDDTVNREGDKKVQIPRSIEDSISRLRDKYVISNYSFSIDGEAPYYFTIPYITTKYKQSFI